MDHATLRELAAGAALDDLDPAEALALDRHLPTCAPCLGLSADLGDVLGELALAAPVLRPPADLRGHVLDALHEPSAPGLTVLSGARGNDRASVARPSPATGAWLATSLASSSARLCKVSTSGRISLIRPSASASSASISRAVKIMSLVRAGPTSDITRLILDIDRQLPSVRAIGKPMRVAEVPMRRSQQAAMPAPPPVQAPAILVAQITELPPVAGELLQQIERGAQVFDDGRAFGRGHLLQG